MSEYEDLLKQYKRRAKLADQYMRRLEKLQASDKRYKGVTNYAYRRAIHDIETWGHWKKGGKPRFDTKPPRTLQGRRAKMKDIERFLTSPTATKRGIDTIYKKRAQTMSEKYGTSADWEDMAKYYSRGLNEKMDDLYGSKTALRAIGRVQKNAKAIRKAIKKGELDTYITGAFGSEDKPIVDTITKMLKGYEEDLKKAGIL